MTTKDKVWRYLNGQAQSSVDKAVNDMCRKWQGLTDDERVRFRQLGFVGVEIVEAALKERNS